MTVDWRRTLLLWDPRDKADFGLNPTDFRSRGIETLQLPYRTMGRDQSLADTIRDTKAEALIFTRNEQMGENLSLGSMLGRLRMGYTCVSAIDKAHQRDQTRQCIADLLQGTADVEILAPARRDPLSGPGKGTFSLVFDLEQLGGARFGIPRLLPLLESRGIRATFFVTGIIGSVYPGLLKRIADGGHEIGIHGAVHEFLQGRSLSEQSALVAGQAEELRSFGEVLGANYIFRMDGLSPEAIAGAGLKYLVLFRKHLFHRTRYIAQSTKPRMLRTATGDIVFLPIGAETYGLKRRDIKSMIESCLNQARRERCHHISVLMHPFRDGSFACWKDTQWVIGYLIRERELRPLTLAGVPRPVAPGPTAVQILYRWDEHRATVPSSARGASFTNSWWAPPVYHSRRTESLADALEHLGVPAALATRCSTETKRVCVYPDDWETERAKVFEDPILGPRCAARNVVKSLETLDTAVVSPGPPWKDLCRFLWFHLPRTAADVATLLARLPSRLARFLSLDSWRELVSRCRGGRGQDLHHGER